MKRLLIAALFPLGLAACNGTNPLTGLITDPNVAVCASALIQSGIIDPAMLAATAATTPACISLAADVVHTIISDVTTQNVHARMMRMQQQH